MGNFCLRYGKLTKDLGSLIIASQRPLKNWHEYLGEGMHADAILDRLKTSSYLIELKGSSLREKSAAAQKVSKVNKKKSTGQ